MRWRLEPDLSSLWCRKAGTGACRQVGSYSWRKLAPAATPPNSHRSRSTDAERAAARQTEGEQVIELRRKRRETSLRRDCQLPIAEEPGAVGSVRILTAW